jgi:hypothetical protein
MILPMGSSNKKKAADLANKVKILYPEYERLTSKIESDDKGLSEAEEKKYAKLKKELYLHVESTTKTVHKFIDAPTLVKIQSIIDSKEEKRNLFTYQPKTSSKDLIVVTSVPVNSPVVNGANKKYKGLPDDLIGFTTQPTLQILGRNELSKNNWKPIYKNTEVISEYTINCSFRLNRFPTRTWYRSKDSSYQSCTARRTEIMRFQYANEDKTNNNIKDSECNFIAIGASAPFQNIPILNDRGDGYTYKSFFYEKFSPFSIGVSFPVGGNHKTIYTDYKFELSKWYNLKIELKKFDYEHNAYRLSIYINGTLEDTAIMNSILWSKEGSRRKRFNIFDEIQNGQHFLEDPSRWINNNPDLLVASSPGFQHNSRNNDINQMGIMGKIDVSQEIRSYLGDDIWGVQEKYQDFNFNILSKIITPPYYTDKLSKSPSPIISEKDKINYVNNWKNHKAKINTSIDYGDISISAK